MAHEIELKLALAPLDQRRFLRHPLLKTATSKTDQILDNTYFDTSDLALRQRGIALRVRKQGRQRLQTVKLAANRLMGAGLSSRPEWETPYRGRFDFSPIEIAEIREWLEQPSILNAIGPLFQTRFRRITWTLPLTAGGEILLALDRGTVLSGGAAEEISEVELELSGSTDVTALQSLAAKLAERVPLVPADISKAQRGYALLAAQNTR
jgi:inorganic triphosphatase YgiF